MEQVLDLEQKKKDRNDKKELINNKDKAILTTKK